MKRILKNIAFLLISLLVLPLVILCYGFRSFCDHDKVFASFSQFLSLVPGIVGVYSRASFFRFTMKSCHKHAHIGFGSLFSQVDTEIHKGVYIGPQCNIGKCTIYDDTLLGSGVHIMSGKNQHYFDDVDTPIREQGGVFANITIGRNCWLGNGALVMANVGDNCVVAAGAVVVNDIPENSIVAGNPAKVIKRR